MNITYAGSNLADAKATLEYYFNASKAVSNDGVYSIEVNWDNYSVAKAAKYDDFEAFYATEATKFDTLYQCQWIYDNNGKNIQLAISINEAQADISFGLLG